MDECDWRLVAALEPGLSLTPEPYHALAERCGLPLTETLQRLQQWRKNGVIRRFGVILHHRPFGYSHNAMCVWNVPDARVDAIGMRIASLPHVTLCYRRPRRLPNWQYNLFAMVHARGMHELEMTLSRFDAIGGLAAMPHAVLRASHCFKQRGTRYGIFRRGSEPSPAACAGLNLPFRIPFRTPRPARETARTTARRMALPTSGVARHPASI
jgi:DNA-binding Lrp family transcriptional regulator